MKTLDCKGNFKISFLTTQKIIEIYTFLTAENHTEIPNWLKEKSDYLGLSIKDSKVTVNILLDILEFVTYGDRKETLEAKEKLFREHNDLTTNINAFNSRD